MNIATNPEQNIQSSVFANSLAERHPYPGIFTSLALLDVATGNLV